jgi:hypothetical protein
MWNGGQGALWRKEDVLDWFERKNDREGEDVAKRVRRLRNPRTKRVFLKELAADAEMRALFNEVAAEIEREQESS